MRTEDVPPDSAPDLDALYAPPSEMITKAVLDRLIDFHRDYLKAATFFCLATGSDAGLDASPRGGPPGFVHVIDPRTIAFADWPGNNRIESMRNVVRDDRVGMLFVFPGLEVFLRINGRARISTDPDLLATLGEGQRRPKAATIVAIREVLMHCGKAVNRAKLWAPESQLDRKSLPGIGTFAAAVLQLGEDKAEEFDAGYYEAMRGDLY